MSCFAAGVFAARRYFTCLAAFLRENVKKPLDIFHKWNYNVFNKWNIGGRYVKTWYFRIAELWQYDRV